MTDVYSIMIWLRDSGTIPLEVSQRQRQPDELTLGHRSFVFNAPALPRIHYAHATTRAEAEDMLRTLGAAIQAGETLYVIGEASFAIPAHSVHYVALGHSEAGAVRSDEKAEGRHAPGAHVSSDEGSGNPGMTETGAE